MATKLPVPAVPDVRDEESDSSDNDALIAQALNPDGTPRRPMNAFMIFARQRRPEITANNPPLRTGEISKVLSSEWAAMSAEKKQFYLDRARKLKDIFNARWPDYVYRRRPNNSRKRKRPDAASPPGSAGPPLVRRCLDPVVPSSKVKHEDEYAAMTSAPLTMMFLGEAEQGRSGLLGGYTGTPLPSMLTYARSTPSLASSILTSSSSSPRSASSSLYPRYGEPVPLTNSPGSKLRDAYPFNPPYVPSMGYLKSQYDDYRDSDRHADWTPPQAVRNTLQLPAFTHPYYPDTPADSPSDFSYHSHSSTSEHFNSGLVPVHPHFTRT